jgi:predicted membrane protein DUF2085
MRESVPSGVHTSALRPAFLAASIAWAALLVLAPWVAAEAHATPIESGFLLAVYALGSGICHQRPERSFFLWAHQMPVCARCAGIYAGAALASIIATWMAPLKGRPTADGEGRSTTDGVGHPPGAGVGRRFSAATRWRVLLSVAALPAAISLVYEWTTGQMPSHWTRAATGLPLGGAVAWLLLEAMAPRARAADQVN